MTPAEQAQWLRLRSLAVQRAERAAAEAAEAVAQAQARLAELQAEIDAQRGALRSHDHDTVHGWAPRLPRWSGTVSLHREALFERLERSEYALIDDEQALEQAEAALHAARAACQRARAREDAVHSVIAQRRRVAARLHEQRLERELDDPRRSGAGGLS